MKINIMFKLLNMFKKKWILRRGDRVFFLITSQPRRVRVRIIVASLSRAVYT